MHKNNTKKKLVIWALLLLFGAWWIFINVIQRSPEHNTSNTKLFAATYGVTALVGGIIGLIASKKWGGIKSQIGRAILFFSIGLLLQEFGQITYSVYQYALKVDIPYPSIGDIGYFGSVLVYIYAAWQLAKAVGFKFSLRARSKKIIALVVPLALLSGSYYYFLRDYSFDFSSLKAITTVILDFGYPLGQALYVAIAVITYLLSKRLLGGLMKNKILLVLFALLVQYVADSSFLYAAKYGKFYAAGANDLMYLIAYSVMSLALTSFIIDFKALQTKPQEEKNDSSQKSEGIKA